METITRLSVDGQHGIDVARSGSTRLVESTSLAIRTTDTTHLDGANGIDAGTAIPGSPGGFLAVQVSSLATNPEGFLVEILAQTLPNQLPTRTEVAAQRNVLLSAVGGNGEPGRKGGDGEHGRTGTEGSPASRTVDAGCGGNGGNGGNAGLGSHGAEGGKGGSVNVIVNENMTHLLCAVKWAVHGGLGGGPGENGLPGEGGRGGRGGAGFEWSQHVGYDLHCTENCVGVSTASAARRAIANRPASASMALPTMLGKMGPQVVQGSNFQSMIAQTAIKYRNFSATNTTPSSDACRCKGGPDGCVGCEKRPVQQIYKRPKGPDGHDGVAGTAAHSFLRTGLQGDNGSASIIVRYVNGTERRFASCYEFQLIDFDVEDETGDGILEPGEYIYIRRIRIRNTGGMPSPSCRIPITILPSRAIIPLAGEQSQTFIPISIQAGGIATADGYIKAKLRLPQARPSSEPYVSCCDISLIATMPYLERRLDGFETSKSFTIQFPIDLRNFHMLPNVAQGSRTDFTWEVHNKGAKRVSFGAKSRRRVNLDVSIPPKSGRLLTRKLGLEDVHGSYATAVEANSSLSVKQTVQISPLVHDYSNVVLRVMLSISTPESYPRSDEFRIIQCCDLKVRVSSRYQYNEESSILVVTNQATTLDDLIALQNHIQGDLGLKMDIWNIALYGSLQRSDPEEEGESFNIVSSYKEGTTVIFLGPSFDFFGMGPRNLLQLSDLSLISRTLQSGVSCLFLGLLNEADAGSWTRLIAFPAHSELSEALSQMTMSSDFANEEQLVRSLAQTRSHVSSYDSTTSAIYTIPVYKKWHLSNQRALDQRASKVASFLRYHLPQEPFWVCPCEPETADVQGKVGRLAIFQGIPLSTQLAITERRRLRGLSGASFSRVNLAEPNPKLSLLDQYACIQSLSISARMNLIQHPPNAGTAAQTADPVFVTTAATLSLVEDFDVEIHIYLHAAVKQSRISFSKDAEGNQRALTVHLPSVAAYFCHLQTAYSEERELSENILLILRYLLASCSTQKKRHTTSRLLLPLQTRRSSLHTFLVSKTTALLAERGRSAAQIQTFLIEWKSWRAGRLARTHSIADAIARSVALLLKTSEHVYKAGKVKASDVGLERTRVCTREEWNARANVVREWERKVKEDGSRARAKLEEMNGGEGIGDDRPWLELPSGRPAEIASDSGRGRVIQTTSI